MEIGIAWIGLALSTCSLLSDLPPRTSLSFLYEFDSSLVACEEILDLKPRLLQAYLSNGSCVRRGDCGDLSPDEEQEYHLMFDRAESFNYDFFQLRPDTEILLAPSLETGMSRYRANKRAIFLGADFEYHLGYHPTLVWNPVSFGKKPRDYDLAEFHGRTSSALPSGEYSVSLDGFGVELIGLSSRPRKRKELRYRSIGNFVRFHRDNGAKVVWFWVRELNGICSPTEAYIRPRDRKCFPNKEIVSQLRKVVRKARVELKRPQKTKNRFVR